MTQVTNFFADSLHIEVQCWLPSVGSVKVQSKLYHLHRHLKFSTILEYHYIQY